MGILSAMNTHSTKMMTSTTTLFERLALLGLEVMRDARVQSVHSALEIESAARRRADRAPRVIIACGNLSNVPRMPAPIVCNGGGRWG